MWWGLEGLGFFLFRNIRDHLWRWSTYFGRNIPVIFSVFVLRPPLMWNTVIQILSSQINQRRPPTPALHVQHYYDIPYIGYGYFWNRTMHACLDFKSWFVLEWIFLSFGCRLSFESIDNGKELFDPYLRAVPAFEVLSKLPSASCTKQEIVFPVVEEYNAGLRSRETASGCTNGVWGHSTLFSRPQKCIIFCFIWFRI